MKKETVIALKDLNSANVESKKPEGKKNEPRMKFSDFKIPASSREKFIELFSNNEEAEKFLTERSSLINNSENDLILARWNQRLFLDEKKAYNYDKWKENKDIVIIMDNDQHNLGTEEAFKEWQQASIKLHERQQVLCDIMMEHNKTVFNSMTFLEQILDSISKAFIDLISYIFEDNLLPRIEQENFIDQPKIKLDSWDKFLLQCGKHVKERISDESKIGGIDKLALGFVKALQAGRYENKLNNEIQI